MRRAPGSSIAGFVPYSNELILSGHFQKKVITVNHNFPGYRFASAPACDPDDNPLQKNQIFYRETTSPGLYAPLQLIIVHAWTTTTLDVLNADKSKLGSVSAANKIHLWDNSGSLWATGAHDRDRYVTVIGADDSCSSGYTRNTTDGGPAETAEATVDAICAAVDAGVVGFIDYVIVDQAIDFRSTAQPAAIAGDFPIDAIYVARINKRMLNGYDVMPSNFLATWKAACQRIIIDVPQI